MENLDEEITVCEWIPRLPLLLTDLIWVPISKVRSQGSHSDGKDGSQRWFIQSVEDQ